MPLLRVLAGLVCLAWFCVCASPTVGLAEDKKPRTLYVPLNGALVVEAPSKKGLANVRIDKAGVVEVKLNVSGRHPTVTFWYMKDGM